MKQLILIFAAFLIIAGFTFPTKNTFKTVSEKSIGYQVGDVAADFNLKNIDDKMVSLESIKDVKGYIVVFTCNSCPVSIAYEDRIIDLHKKYAPMGYPVIAINPNDPDLKPDDSFEEMKVRAAEKEFPFMYLFDEGQKVYPQFGATRTPHVFILDKDRKVKYIGAIDDSRDDTAIKSKYVEVAITQMEKGESPNPPFTKAMGCSIKDKKATMKRSKRSKRKQTNLRSPQRSPKNGNG
ncbi:MAG: thioredoxin family protein [Saprospiraceae bacterium]